MCPRGAMTPCAFGKPSGRLPMTHNSLANLPKSLLLLKTLGLEPRIVAERSLAFRHFIDRAWLDTLGGIEEGLYSVRDGVPYERLCVIALLWHFHSRGL